MLWLVTLTANAVSAVAVTQGRKLSGDAGVTCIKLVRVCVGVVFDHFFCRGIDLFHCVLCVVRFVG